MISSQRKLGSFQNTTVRGSCSSTSVLMGIFFTDPRRDGIAAAPWCISRDTTVAAHVSAVATSCGQFTSPRHNFSKQARRAHPAARTTVRRLGREEWPGPGRVAGIRERVLLARSNESPGEPDSLLNQELVVSRQQNPPQSRKFSTAQTLQTPAGHYARPALPGRGVHTVSQQSFKSLHSLSLCGNIRAKQIEKGDSNHTHENRSANERQHSSSLKDFKSLTLLARNDEFQPHCLLHQELRPRPSAVTTARTPAARYARPAGARAAPQQSNKSPLRGNMSAKLIEKVDSHHEAESPLIAKARFFMRKHSSSLQDFRSLARGAAELDTALPPLQQRNISDPVNTFRSDAMKRAHEFSPPLRPATVAVAKSPSESLSTLDLSTLDLAETRIPCRSLNLLSVSMDKCGRIKDVMQRKLQRARRLLDQPDQLEAAFESELAYGPDLPVHPSPTSTSGRGHWAKLRLAVSMDVLHPSVDKAPARLSGMTLATTLERQKRSDCDGGATEMDLCAFGSEMSDFALQEMISSYSDSVDFLSPDKLQGWARRLISNEMT